MKKQKKSYTAGNNFGLFAGFGGSTEHSMKTDREIKLCELWKAGEPLQQTFCTKLQRLQKSTDSLVLKREFVQIKQRCTDSQSAALIGLVST